jgi:adenylate cyclase
MTDPTQLGDAEEVERTVVFVDLAGFTALTDTHGDRAGLEVADRLVHHSVTQLCPQGALIKSIGDAVMLAFETPEVALRTVGSILGRLGDEPSFPLPCTGMHHGQVMARGGDLFGRRVNIASRLASAASPGVVLGTRPLADAAALAGIGVREVGPSRLRNVTDRVVAFELELGADQAGAHVDPVCRMRVRPPGGTRLELDGEHWWFCSTGCAELFSSRPEDFAS